MGPEKSHWNRLSLARKEGRTRGGARGLSLTGVPRVGKTVGHDGVARGGAQPSSDLFDLHSQHDSMWLGCRGLF